MARKEITSKLVDYLKSEQAKNFMHMLIQTDDLIYHIHINVEYSIHPESLAKLFMEYHKPKGIELDRGIQFSGLPGVGMFINVQPGDSTTHKFLANYELFWFYNPDVLI
jgi:hypothetical protein